MSAVDVRVIPHPALFIVEWPADRTVSSYEILVNGKVTSTISSATVGRGTPPPHRYALPHPPAHKPMRVEVVAYGTRLVGRGEVSTERSDHDGR